MSHNRVRLTVAIILAEPRANNQSKGQGRNAADGVYHPRASKVRISFSKSEVRAQVGKPAAAPSPIREQRIDERAQNEGGYEERRKFPTLSCGSSNDGEG